MISLHIRSMWETTVMHKQVSGWTVNFGPNFPDQSLLRNTPPHFGKLQIWDDQSLLRNTPPHFGKLQIWDDQSLLQNTPPFRKTSDFGWPKFTPEYPPPFRKTSDLGWPKFTLEYPPILENFRFGMNKVYSGIPPPNENCQRVQVRDFQNTESYYMWRLYPTRITTSLDGPPHILLHDTAKRHRSQVWINGLSHEAMFVESGHVFRLIVLIMELLVKKAKRNNKLVRFTQPMLNMTFSHKQTF